MDDSTVTHTLDLVDIKKDLKVTDDDKLKFSTC